MGNVTSNAKAIAEQGENIYRDKYQKEFEANHRGRFAAIEVVTGKVYLADSPEGAVEDGRRNSPNGLFHLIKVGAPGAYRAS